MTTIATDGRSMAGDGRATNQECITASDFVKVHRLADGRIYGVSGNAFAASLFGRFLSGETDIIAKLESDKANFGALVLNTDGTIDAYENDCVPLRLSAPQAKGSGRDFALAAMDAGLSPEEAVKIAIGRDIYSGGNITVETIETEAPSELRDLSMPLTAPLVARDMSSSS